MSNSNIFGIEQALAIIAADGYRVEIINSKTYSSAEQTLLNGAEINSIALGRVGSYDGVWVKTASSNNPILDYKRLSTIDEVNTLLAVIHSEQTTQDGRLHAIETLNTAQSGNITALQEELAPLQVEVTGLTTWKNATVPQLQDHENRITDLEACCATVDTRINNAVGDAVGTVNGTIGNLTDQLNLLQGELGQLSGDTNSVFSVNVDGTTPVELFQINAADYNGVDFTFVSDKNDANQTTYGTTRGFVGVLLPHPSQTGVSPVISYPDQILKLGVSMPNLVFSAEKTGSGTTTTYKIKVAASAASKQKVNGTIKLKVPRTIAV